MIKGLIFSFLEELKFLNAYVLTLRVKYNEFGSKDYFVITTEFHGGKTDYRF